MTLGTIVAVVAAAVAVGALTALHAGAAAAVAAAFALIAVLVSARSSFAPVALGDRRFRWLAFAWAYYLIEPIGHFSTGRSALAAVAGVPSAENVIELGVSALVAGLSLWSLRRNRFDWHLPKLLLALPVLGLISAAWSLAPTVTLGFSFELVAITLLSIVTAALAKADPAAGQALIQQALRFVVVGVAFLCVVGLVDRSGWAQPGLPSRFAWPGAHPLPAAAEVGFALIVIVFGSRRDGGFRGPVRALLLVLFGVCLYFGNSRTAFAGLAVAGLFGYWFISQGNNGVRRVVGATAIGLTVFVLVTSFGGPVSQYLGRGQSQQQIASLDGRVGLWSLAIQELHSPGRWLVGYGLGGTRVLFSTSTTWAADAHSAWLELLLSLGVVGIVAGIAVVAATAGRLFRGFSGPSLARRVLPVLFVYALVMSPAGSAFAPPGPEPGLGFALLAFCFSATVAREPAVVRPVAPGRPSVERELQPAPV